MHLNNCDPKFKHDIAATHSGKGIKFCFACAACSSRCPISKQYPEYDPRLIIKLILMGARNDVLSSPLIWLCSSCYTCQEICPQGVNFTEVITTLKNMAIEAGYVPVGIKTIVHLLNKHGRLLEVTNYENEKRSILGLPLIKEHVANSQSLINKALNKLNLSLKINKKEDTA